MAAPARPDAEQASNDTDRAYAEIRRGIIEGRYAPGVRLIEQRVAEELAVSRTPVREAVRRLESEGLVLVERNRGARVRLLSEVEIADLYDVRARLESYGAELAAIRWEREELVSLRRAAESFDAVVALSVASSRTTIADARRLESANGAFHGTLLQMSRHTRIQRLVAGAVDAPLVFQALQRFAPDELDRSRLFHHLIADAVAQRAPERASRLMTEHVLQGRDALLDRLADVGAVADLFANEERGNG